MEAMNGVKGRAHELEMQQVNGAGFNCELSPLGGPGLLSGLGVRLSASVRPSVRPRPYSFFHVYKRSTKEKESAFSKSRFSFLYYLTRHNNG